MESLLSFLTQTEILLKKSFLLSVRNWKATLVQILCPIVLCAMLFGFQVISNRILGQETIQPKQEPLGVLQPCRVRDKPCTTMLYSPDVPWVRNLMQRLAVKSNLNFTRDFKAWPSGFFFVLDYLNMYKYLNTTANQNTTQNAIIFKTGYDYTGEVMPPDPGYLLFWNSSNGYNPYGAEIVRTLDEAILSMKLNVSVAEVTIEVTSAKYPVQQRITQLDIVAQNGAIWFFLPPMITFFMVLTEVVGEKESRLRIGMRMMGLSNGPYWLVWWINGVVLVLLSTSVLIASGCAFQFDFFLNANIGAIFLLFGSFGMAITSFAMLIASVINSAATAQTVGYAFVLVGFVFQTILSSASGLLVDMLWVSTAAEWVIVVRWILMLYPPFNMAKVFADIASKAGSTINVIEGRVVPGVGFKWADLYKERDIEIPNIMSIVVPSPLQSLAWMTLFGFCYLIVMWYLDNVLPGEHGSPRPFYFLFTPQFWGFKSKSSAPTFEPETQVLDQDVQAEKDSAFSQPHPLTILSVSKIYQYWPFWKSAKDLRAVDKLSLFADEGEILCLLGHNGAGKTTLVNMLTGLFAPSAGSATIGGLNIDRDMDVIRKSMGVCPQHDILWAELTAREHLQLFCRLKGFSGIASDFEVSRVLTLINLAHVADNRVSSFSGGMKRRLSVGISTIGNPSIIFMDEPTTGLDPVNKRKLWHMIQDLKRDRVIVLTTHSMDEADVLSDKVAIMAKGRLHCVGNGLHLKKRFGSGYRITAVTPNGAAFATDFQTRWPMLRLEESDAGSLQFTIPLDHEDKMPSIMDYLEKNPFGLIKEWGISHATLEEVFLNVTKSSNFGFSALSGEVGDGIIANAGEDAFGEQLPVDETDTLLRDTVKKDRTRPSYPFRALFRKNLTLQGRQYFTNFCQILTPVLVIILLLVLQQIIKYELGDNFNKQVMVQTFPYPLNDPLLFNDLYGALTSMNFSNFPNHNGAKLGHECELFFYYTDNTGGKGGFANSLWPPRNVDKAGVLGEIIQNQCKPNNGDSEHATPYFFNKTSLSAINLELFQGIETINKLPMEEIGSYPNDVILPDGYVVFNEIDTSKFKLSMSLGVNDNSILFYHRKNNFTRTGITLPKNVRSNAAVEKMQLISYIGKVQLIDLMTRAYMNYTLKQEKVAPLNYSSNGLDAARLVQEMPTIQVPLLMDVFEAFGTLLFPISMNLQLPIYIFILVLEKKTKVREMMKSHGMRTWHYYLVNYIFFFVLYCAALAFFWIAGLAVDLRVFVQTHWSIVGSFYLSWGLALVSLAFFISSFVSDPRAATVTGYGVAMLGTMIGLVVCLGIYGPLNFQSHDYLPWGLLLWPQFPYVRGIYLMNFACATALQCYGPLWHTPLSTELVHCILALFSMALVYFVLFLYLDAVLPREYGIPKHPLFFLHALRDSGRNLFKKQATLRGDGQMHETYTDSDLPEEDADVKQMRLEVEAGHFSPSDPLVTNRLRKVYDDGKLALVDLNLIIHKNTCFGLLGENGAGKTTTISMLTGLYSPTSGSALVGGYDIRTEIDEVHLAMGLCPQFDVLWDDLTPKEHLLFYARVKGIDPGSEDLHVNALLSDVGLFEARDRPAVKLSGGMRRRLSLAISLVGDSKIVFLDEPTTGLDPATRRHIWAILARTKRGRAIILTTHSMDEAETLCNVIGILAHGTMRCLGSPQHLRSAHGEGYRLTVSFDARDLDSVRAFVQKRFPSAVNVSMYRSTMEYRIPAGAVPVSLLFQAMESESKTRGVKDWALNQLGLDDVFQAIVRDSNRARLGVNDE